MSLMSKASNIVLLDGSPTQMSASIELYREAVNARDPKQQQIEALIVFILQFVPIDTRKVREELSALNDEQDRNEKAAEIISSNNGPKCDPMELAFASTAFFQKLTMLKNYLPKSKTSANITLIRAEEPIIKGVDLTTDYGLGQLAQSPVTVKTLRGNHKTFLSNNVKDIVDTIDTVLN